MFLFLKTLQNIFGVIFRLPPPAAVYLMRFAAETTYQVARLTAIKKKAADNLKKLFPERETGSLADKLLRNVGYAIFEIMCAPFFKSSHINRICRTVGLENLDRALAERKGVMLLSMHTGNYELVPALLVPLGYRLVSILKASDNPLFKLLNRSRGYRGARLINVMAADMYRESLQALSHNEIVCLLIDTGALEGRHELFPFLGRKVPVATGWLTLAERSGASVVPVFSKREGKKVVFTFGEPLRVYRDNRVEVMQKVGNFFEVFIKNHPEQWGIFLNSHEVERMVRGN